MGTHRNESGRIEDDLSEVAYRLRKLYLDLQSIQLDDDKFLEYHHERGELLEKFLDAQNRLRDLE